jgi:MarR family transcriptional regulator, organic hydroperoxide resistance regulator
MHSISNAFSREISSFFDHYFEPFDLTTSYAEILMMIEEAGEITQKEIAERMHLAPSTITRFVGKLEKAGFIEKNRNGKAMTVSVRKEKNGEISKIREQFEKAEKELSKIVGKKFVDTTAKLLEFGVDQFQHAEED